MSVSPSEQAGGGGNRSTSSAHNDKFKSESGEPAGRSGAGGDRARLSDRYGTLILLIGRLTWYWKKTTVGCEERLRPTSAWHNHATPATSFCCCLVVGSEGELDDRMAPDRLRRAIRRHGWLATAGGRYC